MSGPDNPEYKWGGEGQSEPTRAIPTTPGQGFQPQPPHQPWSQNPPGQGAPPPPQPGAWGQPPVPPQTPAWGMPPQAPPPGQQAWGQPPQQQWAPPPSQSWQQPGQPGQPEYGQFPPPTQGKSKLPLILGLVAAAVVLLALIGAAVVFGPKIFGSPVLDQGAVESGVQTVLTDSYGLQAVSDVSCPADQKVETGATFTCSVSVDGEARTVTIRIIDDEGTYEVSKPQ